MKEKGKKLVPAKIDVAHFPERVHRKISAKPGGKPRREKKKVCQNPHLTPAPTKGGESDWGCLLRILKEKRPRNNPAQEARP